MSDTISVAAQIRHAFEAGETVAPPTSIDPAFDMTAAYAVERELARGRRANGRTTVGWKVGFANKALWRALKLDTLVWAHMYDDTVSFATGGEGTLTLRRPFAPKIEPEIVFKMKAAVPDGTSDPAAVLRSVEWIALGFELADCPFPDWKFQPVDFVAAYGLHAALVVGTPMRLDDGNAEAVAEKLARFTLRLSKDGQLIAEGAGENVLRSPALCLIELAAAMARRQPAETLRAGDLITSGSLTVPQPIGSRGTWQAMAVDLDVAPLTLQV